MLEAAGWEQSGGQKRLQDIDQNGELSMGLGKPSHGKTWTSFLANPILKSFELLWRLTSHPSPKLATGQLHKYPWCRGLLVWESHDRERLWAMRQVLPEQGLRTRVSVRWTLGGDVLGCGAWVTVTTRAKGTWAHVPKVCCLDSWFDVTLTPYPHLVPLLSVSI